MFINKRAQLFSLYLFIFAFFLCGVVISLYIIQQGNAQALLVSPNSVLEMKTELNILELREMELIKNSLDGLVSDIGSDDFHNSFRVNFINGVVGNKNMTDFLFKDLFVGGIEIREQDKNRNLLESVIYPESLMFIEDGDFVFGRAKIEKRSLLITKAKNKDFPVYFEFEFNRKYSISKVNGVLEVIKL